MSKISVFLVILALASVALSQSCPSGYYYSTNAAACAQCPLFCNACSNSSYCTTCASNFKLYDNALAGTVTCITANCPNGQYYNIGSGKCQLQCAQGCFGCQPMDNSYCTSCVQGYYLDGSKCVSQVHYEITTMAFVIIIFILLLIKMIVDFVLAKRRR